MKKFLAVTGMLVVSFLTAFSLLFIIDEIVNDKYNPIPFLILTTILMIGFPLLKYERTFFPDAQQLSIQNCSFLEAMAGGVVFGGSIWWGVLVFKFVDNRDYYPAMLVAIVGLVVLYIGQHRRERAEMIFRRSLT